MLWVEFRWWVVLAIAVIGTAHLMAYEQHRAAAQYQSHRASYCTALGGTAKEKIACEEEKYDVKSDLPWWAILHTWPEGMTVWAIIGTGFIIAWQSHETRKAAKATEASAEGVGQQSGLIKRQADAMDDQNRSAKDRERARLIIRQLETPEIYPRGSAINGDRALKVRVIVENLGGSRAFNVRAWAMMNIVSHPRGDHYDVGNQQVFPSIIDADLQKHLLNVAGLGREFEGIATVSDYLAVPEELAQRIRNGEVFIVASGMLVYEDIFLDTYETPFHFVWHSFGNDDGRMWLTESYWTDRSPSPRRVHAEQKDKLQKPN